MTQSLPNAVRIRLTTLTRDADYQNEDDTRHRQTRNESLAMADDDISPPLFRWDLTDFPSQPFAFCVLNQPLVNPERVHALWLQAQFRVLVDGGANRWRDLLQQRPSAQVPATPEPDLLTGDFDSIDPDLCQYYREHPSTRVVDTPDQDHTDFTKALIETAQTRPDLEWVLAYVEHAGRVDQIFANFQTLFQISRLIPRPLKVVLVSGGALTWVLAPGQHEIRPPLSLTPERCHIGLIPLGQPVSGVVTRGLKWDLDGQVDLAFGGLVSTSNTLAKANSIIHIFTARPLLFTIDQV